MKVNVFFVLGLGLTLALGACSHVPASKDRQVASVRNDGNDTGNRPAFREIVRNHCEAPANFKMLLDNNRDQLHAIKSFDSLYEGGSGANDHYDLTLNVQGKTEMDVVNGEMRHEQVSMKDYVEKFTLDQSDHGMLFKLIGNENNTFEFHTVFLKFGDYNVQTAGPIPPGTWPLQMELVFVTDKPVAGDLLTVRKVIFNCQSEVKYPSMP